jgi:steroid 5-alpha reductase family enzyme
MLWTICVILLVLWLLGLVSGYTLGGVSHSRPAGHRRHCGRCPIDPGPKMIARI